MLLGRVHLQGSLHSCSFQRMCTCVRTCTGRVRGRPPSAFSRQFDQRLFQTVEQCLCVTGRTTRPLFFAFRSVTYSELGAQGARACSSALERHLQRTCAGHEAIRGHLLLRSCEVPTRQQPLAVFASELRSGPWTPAPWSSSAISMVGFGGELITDFGATCTVMGEV